MTCDAERVARAVEEALYEAEADGADRHAVADVLERLADAVRDGYTHLPEHRGQWWQAVHSDDPETESTVDVRECEICAEERANVEDVTLGPWPASTVAACPVCRYFYDTEDREECLTCGSADAKHYVELEASIGAVGFPGCLAGSLCEECATHFASEVTQLRRTIPVDVLVAAAPDRDRSDYEEDRSP